MEAVFSCEALVSFLLTKAVTSSKTVDYEVLFGVEFNLKEKVWTEYGYVHYDKLG